VKANGKEILRRFFEPQSIAVVGSFKEGFFGGYVLIKTVLEAGFRGRIFPVNPAYREVLGLKVYGSVKELPESVDLVFLIINAGSVLPVMEDCAARGIRAAVVVSDGFAERDAEGGHLQEELVAFGRKKGIRIIGPNTAGVVNTANGFNPCPYEAGYHRLPKGPVAICSQTGMINPQAYPYRDLRCGVSKICDFGNKSDVDECDVLEYLEEDNDTAVISMYLEGIRDGKRFLDVSKRVTKKKPVLVLKSGRTQEGARASASHTGSMAVKDTVFDAVCRQGGIIRLDTFQELFQVPKIFASQPLPRGNRMGILTVTGGVGVMAIDEGARYGLEIARPEEKTISMLEGIFPGAGRMPVDIGPMMAAVKDTFARYPRILEAVMTDQNVDAVLNVIWAGLGENAKDIYLRAYEPLKGRFPKPLVTWTYGPDSNTARDLAFGLEDLGFPVYSDAESCVKALGLSFRYAQIKGHDASGKHPSRTNPRPLGFKRGG